MSRKRQQDDGADDRSILIRSLGLQLPSDHCIPSHHHDWHQLVYASKGVMTVSTNVGHWVVPPERAVWIPAGFEHSVRMTGLVFVRTLYFRGDIGGGLRMECAVIHMTPLLRELILETVRRGMLRGEDLAQARLAGVIVDQIVQTGEMPLQVVLPSDPRGKYVAERALKNLARTPRIAELVRGSGAGIRTIERLFLKETHLTFGKWLQRAKMLRALELLAGEESVTAAGLSVGYDSTSAFISAFKQVLGTTPGRYFHLRESSRSSEGT